MKRSDEPCVIEGCSKKFVAYRGRLCRPHYEAAKADGTLDLVAPLPPRLPIAERFWSKVEKSDGCWLWLGMKSKGRAPGYGTFVVTKRVHVRAHRFAYELLVGPIADGLVLDHLCRNPSCVNPKHLEPVTNRENVLRGVGPVAEAAAATHCKHGHPYTPENTSYRTNKRSRFLSRVCLTCSRARANATAARVRAAKAAAKSA